MAMDRPQLPAFNPKLHKVEITHYPLKVFNEYIRHLIPNYLNSRTDARGNLVYDLLVRGLIYNELKEKQPEMYCLVKGARSKSEIVEFFDAFVANVKLDPLGTQRKLATAEEKFKSRRKREKQRTVEKVSIEDEIDKHFKAINQIYSDEHSDSECSSAESEFRSKTCFSLMERNRMFYNKNEQYKKPYYYNSHGLYSYYDESNEIHSYDYGYNEVYSYEQYFFNNYSPILVQNPELRGTQIIIQNPCGVPRMLANVKPLPRFEQMNLNESELADLMSVYQIPKEKLGFLGYPVSSTYNPDRVTIYVADFSKQLKQFNVNALEFVPGSYSSDEEHTRKTNDPLINVKRTCARCSTIFFMTKQDVYITTENCKYHWGRLQKRYDEPPESWKWSCCEGTTKYSGCALAATHVWSGKIEGINGPFEGYVKTTTRDASSPKRQILALDSEMCYTGAGLQLAKLEVIGSDGCRVYGTYVHPELPIVDYNTRYSGITAEDMQNPKKTLKQVQTDLLQLIDADTLLVGHGLENDLRALKMLHGKIVDTSVIFPHERGLPYRKSLKSLAEMVLGNDVQKKPHCPLEDARIALDLVLWRIQQEYIPHTINNEAKY